MAYLVFPGVQLKGGIFIFIPNTDLNISSSSRARIIMNVLTVRNRYGTLMPSNIRESVVFSFCFPSVLNAVYVTESYL